MKRGLFYTLALVSLILQIKFSSAYIDPGTGTAIATSMWPALVGILGLVGAFIIKIFFTPIKKTSKAVWGKITRK